MNQGTLPSLGPYGAFQQEKIAHRFPAFLRESALLPLCQLSNTTFNNTH